MSEVPAILVFSSAAFNTTEPQPYFLNPGCFGDDVARALIAALRTRAIATDEEPDQEDFGWTFDFTVEGLRHTFVLGWRPSDDAEPGVWIGTLERARGALGSLFGRRSSGIAPAARAAIHAAVSALPQVRDIAWCRAEDLDADARAP